MTRQTIGVWMVVAAYALLVYITVSAPFYAKAHSHLDPALLAQYSAPWPVALACCLALMGIMLALIPLRRGERWSLWTALTIFVILFVTRITTDPRCLVVFDPHQHGCHSFMISVVLGMVGLVLARK
jgi:nicotinamide riboside transporter PnuC